MPVDVAPEQATSVGDAQGGRLSIAPSTRITHGRLTVGGRLWLINGLLAGAILMMILQSWHTLDQHRLAAEQLSALRLAQHTHRKAQLSHQGVQVEVENGFRARALGAVPRAQALARIQEQAASLRRLLRDLEALPVPEPIRRGQRDMTPGAERYAESAQRLATLNDQDYAAALRAAPALGQQFQQLGEQLAAQAARIDRSLAEAEAAANTEHVRAKWRLAILGALVMLATCALVLLVARSLRRTLRQMSAVARRIAGGEFGVRAPVPAQDELGDLGDAINTMARNLEGMIERLRAKAQEDTFANQLDDAFEMADSEAQAREVVAQAMRVVDPELPMDLHLADAERLHLSLAAHHPLAGGAGCTVETPAACVAVRRGVTQVFPDSEALNACPRLRGRGALSAVCVPMSFMGRALGVLHAAAPAGAPPDPACVQRLNTLGMQAGTRIGTLRSIRRTQMQADTDTLTGLLNRRALEREALSLESAGRDFAMVMADIDHFKRLNDTLGHDAGDRALRAFAEALRRATGERGHVARWGGEEFVLLLPALDASAAHALAETLRAGLAQGLPSGLPAFTASFGVADSTMAGGFRAALELADGALYRAKDGGRNRVFIAAPGQPAKAQPADAH